MTVALPWPGYAASATVPSARTAPAHSTTSSAYAARSDAVDRTPPARNHNARISSLIAAVDRTEPQEWGSGDMASG